MHSQSLLGQNCKIDSNISLDLLLSKIKSILGCKRPNFASTYSLSTSFYTTENTNCSKDLHCQPSQILVNTVALTVMVQDEHVTNRVIVAGVLAITRSCAQRKVKSGCQGKWVTDHTEISSISRKNKQTCASIYWRLCLGNLSHFNWQMIPVIETETRKRPDLPLASELSWTGMELPNQLVVLRRRKKIT